MIVKVFCCNALTVLVRFGILAACPANLPPLRVTMAASWYQITLEVPNQFAEYLADYLSELSGCGVCTDNRDVDTFSTEDIAKLSSTKITCYFNIPCNIEQHLSDIKLFLAGISDQMPYLAPNVSILGEEDWATSWKTHFKPIEIGERLIITPSWEQQTKDNERKVILLDPGMAFGTGGHETTRLCLECLVSILTSTGSNADTRVLDLGTGSGILAIAAAKLGATKIDAVDIDPQAVIVATENCTLNGEENKIRCSNTPLEQLEGSYKIILANILAEELVRMAPEIIKHLSSGGDLILSGILAEREQLVRDGFDPLHLDFKVSLADGEWRCLHYRSQL